MGAAPAQPEFHPPSRCSTATGTWLERWTQWEGMLNMPHFVTRSPYDPEKAVWVISREGQQIFKLSNDGKELLLTLGGKGVQASDQTHFGVRIHCHRHPPPT